MKKAFITGVTGQDGSYLIEFLLDKGYEVYGFVRRSSVDPYQRLESFLSNDRFHIVRGNMRDLSTIRLAMEEVVPDEVYNLAAQSHVGLSFRCPDETFDVDYYGVGRIVNEAMKVNKDVRIYQASTSEMFGCEITPQSETTPFDPISPYAEAKVKAHEEFIKGYREKYGIYACSGILFNHESPRRGKQFVTRKITHSFAKIKLGQQDLVELGNINSRRDWGYAKDYVEAMWMMLQQDTPDDYVIGMGKSYSVRDFVEAAAKAIGRTVTWEGSGVDEVGKDQDGNIIVRINEKFYRPTDPADLVADPSKAMEKLGWKPKTSFEELVDMMVTSDIEALSAGSRL